MGCCGRGNEKDIKHPIRKLSAKGVEPGMNTITLRYIGKNWGTQSYYGPTGTRYRFGGSRAIGVVKGEDVDKLLSLRENGKPLFAVEGTGYSMPSPVPRPKGKRREQAVEAPQEEVELPRIVIDPRELTTLQLKESIEASTPMTMREIEQMIELENSGKARQSILNYLGGLMKALK